MIRGSTRSRNWPADLTCVCLVWWSKGQMMGMKKIIFIHHSWYSPLFNDGRLSLSSYLVTCLMLLAYDVDFIFSCVSTPPHRHLYKYL
jgi:hypothetical protein